MSRTKLVDIISLAFMVIFMTGVVTAINTGIDPLYPLRWAKSFAIACPVALIFTELAMPQVRRLLVWMLIPTRT